MELVLGLDRLRSREVGAAVLEDAEQHGSRSDVIRLRRGVAVVGLVEGDVRDVGGAAAAVRGLAHATRSVEDPTAVYPLLGALSSALSPLSQSLHQLGDFHDRPTRARSPRRLSEGKHGRGDRLPGSGEGALLVPLLRIPSGSAVAEIRWSTAFHPSPAATTDGPDQRRQSSHTADSNAFTVRFSMSLPAGFASVWCASVSLSIVN